MRKLKHIRLNELFKFMCWTQNPLNSTLLLKQELDEPQAEQFLFYG